jgi:hypothetical protein
LKDTRAYAFIGNRDAAQYCDECQRELAGYERFVCHQCDPDAHEWEWEDHDGEVWEDPDRGILLVVGTHERDARCLDCLVLDAVEYNSFVSWPQWSDGEVVQYMRSQFVLGRVDGTKMRRIL